MVNLLTAKLIIERLRVRHLAAPKGQRSCLDDYIKLVFQAVRLCGVVGRVPTFYSRGPGSIPGQGGDFSEMENHRPGFRTG